MQSFSIAAILLFLCLNQILIIRASDGELRIEFQTRQDALEQKFMELLKVEQVERQKLETEVKDLRLTMDKLQAKLNSLSEDTGTLKKNTVSFFKAMSDINKMGNLESSVSETEINEGGFEYESLISEAETENGAPRNISNTDDGSQLKVTLEMNSTGGVSYVRWGRTKCEGDADVLYTGYAGQKRQFVTPGAWPGSDYLCLHNTPEWRNPVSTIRNFSTISGVEYRMFSDDRFDKGNLGGQDLMYHDTPCAVCHVDTRSHQIMIPARMSCPTGWTLEYWGYLVTSSYEVSGHPYLCLDMAPEGVSSGGSDAGTAGLYTVEAYCTALPCPPYVGGYEITCAVCSK